MILNGFEITKYSYPLFVAEISCNHCGNLENVFKLIEKAKYAKADFVKIQVYTPDELTIDSNKPDFIINMPPWKGKNLYSLYERAHTPREWVKPIFEYAKSINMPIFSSVFGPKSLEVLEKNGCQIYKIASFEANHIDLIKSVLELKKPILISTGILNTEGVSILYNKLPFDNDIMFMHCVSNYPTKFQNARLFNIKKLHQYSNHVGYSDHTTGIEAAKIATALGAKVIEKHFFDPVLSKNSEDNKFSAGSTCFSNMVKQCNDVWEACINTDYIEPTSKQLGRSIYVVKDIKKGEVFTEQNIRVIRPGYGINPFEYTKILSNNKKATKDISVGTPLLLEHLND